MRAFILVAALCLCVPAVCVPTPSHASGYPPLYPHWDQLINGIGISHAFDEDTLTTFDLGFLALVGKATLIGGMASLGVGDELTRLAIGPHIRRFIGGGPEFVYRRVDGRDEYGAAVNLSANISYAIFGFALTSRAGMTRERTFAEAGFSFFLTWPVGPRIAEQLPSSYPRCEVDRDCARAKEVCAYGVCRECVHDTHCSDGMTCVRSRCALPEPPRPSP